MSEPKKNELTKDKTKERKMESFCSLHPLCERKPYVILRNCEIPFSVIEVPATCGGNPVKELRGFLLYNPKVEEVIVPEGIEVLGPGAIAFCEKLRKLTLPHSLREIDERALNKELKVRELHWSPHPDCRISRDTFYFMRQAFDENGCFIRGGMLIDTSIGDWSDDRKSLVMPEDLKGVCVSGLYEGKGNIYLSSHHRVPVVTLKKASAIEIFFEGRIPLKSLSRSLFQWEFKTMEKQTLHIGEGVECIEEKALVDCTSLTHVFLPKSLKRMEAFAFQNCSSLEEITIPEGIESIKTKTFAGCSRLKKIHLPKSLKKIGEDAFSCCLNLKEISLPDGVDSIGEGAFRDCTALKKVNIPLGLKRIREDTFLNCGKLTKLFLPKSVEDVEVGAFRGCRTLVAVVLEEEESITIEQGAFPYREGWMPPYMKIVGKWDFEDQVRSSWNLFEKYKTMSPVEREGWVDLLKLLLKAELRSEENIVQEKMLCCKKVFRQNNKEKIALYLSLEVLKEMSHMDYFIEQSIAEKNTEVTAMLLSYKRSQCSQEQMEEYETRQELLAMGMEVPTQGELRRKWETMEKGGGIYLVKYHGKGGEEIVPAATEEGTQILGLLGAAKGNVFQGLRSLVLEEGVQEIEGAFPDLENVHLPVGVRALGEGLFHDSALTRLELPWTVTTIGKGLANGSKLLGSVVLPRHLKTLPAASFYQCEALVEVSFPDTLRRIKEKAFFGTGFTSLTFPDSVTIIDIGAFSYCPFLQRVVLPKNLKLLGESAFSQCKSLTEVYLDGDISVLRWNAFAGCPSLQFVGKSGGDNQLEELRRSARVAKQ